jgi:hypothetical protein
MKPLSRLRPSAVLSLVAAALLQACGGGGGGGSTPTTPGNTSPQASLSLSLAGGTAAGYQHVWVTVKSVALAVDPTLPWLPDDPRWTVIRLPTPVTLDLAALTSGTLGNLLVGQVLTPGSYGQIRLLLAAHDASLETSAKTLNLQFNDEVDYVDAQGAAHQQALELPQVNQGYRIAGPFVLAANVDTDVTVQWDVAHSVVPVALGSSTRFLLRGDFQSYDLENSGAIAGVMDKSLFCPANQPGPNCIYDAVASAQVSAADGSLQRSVRSAPVTLSGDYAIFGLYPLPALSAGQTFDVVIRGRNMRTMVVRHVAAPPAPLLQAPPVELGANPDDPKNPLPIVPVLDPSGGTVQLTQGLQQAQTTLVFGQTLSGPSPGLLEVSALNLDPFSGLPVTATPLPGGPLMVAEYDAKQPLSFSAAAPTEGTGAYTVTSIGRVFDQAPSPTVATPDSQDHYVFTAPEPVLRSDQAPGTLSVGLSGGSTATFDAAELVVSDANGIVLTRDVSGAIGKGASLAFDLPAGPAAAALGSGSYSVSVRVWKRSNASGTGQWVRAAPLADLVSHTSASASLTLP